MFSLTSLLLLVYLPFCFTPLILISRTVNRQFTSTKCSYLQLQVSLLVILVWQIEDNLFCFNWQDKGCLESKIVWSKGKGRKKQKSSFSLMNSTHGKISCLGLYKLISRERLLSIISISPTQLSVPFLSTFSGSFSPKFSTEKKRT